MEFYGSNIFYQYFAGGSYTEGLKYLADKAGAYWLIDAVFSYARKEPFQCWTLKTKDGDSTLTMAEDSDAPVLVTQTIPETNFPIETLRMYLIADCLMLLAEY